MLRKIWEQIKFIAEKYPNLVSFISFILFFLFVSKFFPWRLALIISVSLAMHEYAHALAMKMKGMQVRAVIFIPMFGALAIGGERIWTRAEECFIALAGPIVGFASAGLSLMLFYLTGVKDFYNAIFFIVLINHFNLLPLSPLDGGRVVKSLLMSFKENLRVIGFVLWVVLFLLVVLALGFLKAPIWISFLIGFMAWREFQEEWRIHKIRKIIAEELRQKWNMDIRSFEWRDLSIEQFRALLSEIENRCCDFGYLRSMIDYGINYGAFTPMRARQVIVLSAFYIILFVLPLVVMPLAF